MANLHIRNAGEERESEPMIKQSAMRRILEDKDNQYKDMRHHYEEKVRNKVSEISLHIHNEKQYMRIVKEKDRLVYIVGGSSFFVGGLLGWLMH